MKRTNDNCQVASIFLEVFQVVKFKPLFLMHPFSTH